MAALVETLVRPFYRAMSAPATSSRRRDGNQSQTQKATQRAPSNGPAPVYGPALEPAAAAAAEPHVALSTSKLYVETEETRASSRRQSEMLAKISGFVDKKKEEEKARNESKWSNITVHRYVLLDRAPVAVVCDDPDSAEVQELVKEFDLHRDAIQVKAKIQLALTCSRLDLA